MTEERKRQLAWRIVAFVAAAMLFVRVVRSANLDRAGTLITQIGPAVVVVALPYLLVIGFDALAWQWLLAVLGRQLSFFRLLAVRLSTEAVLLSFPGGAVLAEGLKPLLLARNGVPVAETTATLAAKKVLLIGTQSIYLALAALLGWSALETISASLHLPVRAQVAVLAVSLVLATIAAAMLLTFLHGSLGVRAHRLLERIPSARLRMWLAEEREGFAAADTHLAAVFGAHVNVLLRAAGPFLLSWLAESLESWVVLHLLGASLSFTEVMAFEAIVSLLRSMIFFVPAGLGVQDAGYMLSLRALAIRDPINVAAAFVLLKRAKEVFWIVTGYTMLHFVRNVPAVVVPKSAEEVRPNDD